MIQRIQTLFLLAAAGLLTSMVFTPMIRFTDGATVIRYVEFTPTLIMLIVTVVLSFVNIFSFKNRLFQIRTCNLNTLICVGFQILPKRTMYDIFHYSHFPCFGSNFHFHRNEICSTR